MSSSSPNPPANSETWLTRLGQTVVLIAFASFAVVPLLMYGCAGETERWRAAAAINLYEDGQTDLAIERMEEIAGSSSTEPLLQLQLAQMFAMNERGAEGLEICDRLMEQTESSRMKDGIRGVRVNCLQATGRFKAALEEYKSTLPRPANSPSDKWRNLNNLAYFRALAGTELDAAFKEIQQAINGQESAPVRSKELKELLVLNAEAATRSPLSLRTRALLAAVVVSRELDCRENVLPILSRFIQEYEQSLNATERSVTAAVYDQIKKSFPLTAVQTRSTTDQKRTDRWLTVQELAYLRTARALLFQDKDQVTECDRDRQRVKQLGLDAEVIASKLPRGVDCLRIFNASTMTLDTRGFVRYRGATRPSQLVQAKFDMDVAVLAAELNRKTFDSPMRNSTEEVGDVRLARRGAKRTHAVLLYHRMLVNRTLRNEQGAKQDETLIRELGFPPDARLY